MARPKCPVRIALLADHRHCLPVLQDWFEAEWQPYYGPDGDGDAEHDLQECCRRDGLPLALVALDEEGNPVGTAALRQSSVGAQPGEGPWLTALLVAPERRRRGIATALVSAVADEALARGFSEIFVTAGDEHFIGRQPGWRALRQETSLRGPVTVFSKQMPELPSP